MSERKTGPRPSDKWIPLYLTLGFVTMLSPLAPMAYYAVHTLPGVVTENSYEKGLAYNKAIAAGAQAASLGWQGTLDMQMEGDKATVSYDLRDAKGQAIPDAAVHVWLVRPAQGGVDRDAEMTSDGKGHYSAAVTLAEHGAWDLRASVLRDGHNFQSTQRIVVP